MNPDLLLIFSFIVVITALAFGIGLKIVKREHAHKERKLELEVRREEALAAQARQVNADYSKFEERLRVLERIATDGNHMLASQIEELRTLDAIENRNGGRENVR